MANCNKCGASLKEPFKFCSNCGSRHMVESINEKDQEINKIKHEDEFTEEDNKEHNNHCNDNELIIGEICTKIYMN